LALLDKVVAAKGGLEKACAPLKSIVARQTQVSQPCPPAIRPWTPPTYIEYPSHLRVESPGQVQA